MYWFAMGAGFAGIGVALGAFGAHGIRATLSPEMLAVYETGVRYQMFHALALLALGLATKRRQGRLLAVAGWLFVAGIVVFSGTLYVLAATGLSWLGMLTPVGGLALILAWACLAIATARGV